MTQGLGLMPLEDCMDTTKTTAEAGDDCKTKNEITKECLTDDVKRGKMNEAMSVTIAADVYDHSLARVLLHPHRISEGSCPVFSEGENGPAVVVHLVTSEERVLDCRAFRDSLREEERVKTVRDIEFIPMRGTGIRPSSFPLSNVCTVRSPELNGNAFGLVERARQRMCVSLATDETRVALRAIRWVSGKFGRILWSKSMATSEAAISNAIEAIGLKNNPVVICSPLNAIGAIDIFDIIGNLKARRRVDPIVGYKMDDGSVVPVFINETMPDHIFYIVPSGRALGEMSIFVDPTVQTYDKPERLIKGWLCFQDQGMIFTGTKLTNVVYLGWKGIIEMMKNLVVRVTS